MRCEEINLIQFLEGQDETGNIRAHLESCQACRKELDDFRRLITFLTGARKSALAARTDDPDTAPLPDRPLPAMLVEMIRRRKAAWAQSQEEQHMNLISFPDRKTDEPLLNAAFPDDLLQGRSLVDDESENEAGSGDETAGPDSPADDADPDRGTDPDPDKSD